MIRKKMSENLAAIDLYDELKDICIARALYSSKYGLFKGVGLSLMSIYFIYSNSSNETPKPKLLRFMQETRELNITATVNDVDGGLFQTGDFLFEANNARHEQQDFVVRWGGADLMRISYKALPIIIKILQDQPISHHFSVSAQLAINYAYPEEMFTSVMTVLRAVEADVKVENIMPYKDTNGNLLLVSDADVIKVIQNICAASNLSCVPANETSFTLNEYRSVGNKGKTIYKKSRNRGPSQDVATPRTTHRHGEQKNDDVNSVRRLVYDWITQLNLWKVVHVDNPNATLEFDRYMGEGLFGSVYRLKDQEIVVKISPGNSRFKESAALSIVMGVIGVGPKCYPELIKTYENLTMTKRDGFWGLSNTYIKKHDVGVLAMDAYSCDLAFYLTQYKISKANVDRIETDLSKRIKILIDNDIIYSDVKPQNILVEHEGGKISKLCITDFDAELCCINIKPIANIHFDHLLTCNPIIIEEEMAILAFKMQICMTTYEYIIQAQKTGPFIFAKEAKEFFERCKQHPGILESMLTSSFMGLPPPDLKRARTFADKL